MSQSHFSKLDPKEKETRLQLLGTSKGELTVWIKGQKDKKLQTALEFISDRNELILQEKDNIFPAGTTVLCSFELRGMSFFSQTQIQKGITGHNVLVFNSDLFKSERRASYRLLTFPIYEVYSEFDLPEGYQGGNVIGMKTRSSQTALFKNFLKLIENREENDKFQSIRYRVQDLSATGMALHVGELESQFFSKDTIYKNVRLVFNDETIVIPEVLIVYLVDYVANDRNIKKFKVGLHFLNLPTNVDDQLGKKINKLLREIDFNKDFENFIK